MKTGDQLGQWIAAVFDERNINRFMYIIPVTAAPYSEPTTPCNSKSRD